MDADFSAGTLGLEYRNPKTSHLHLSSAFPVGNIDAKEVLQSWELGAQEIVIGPNVMAITSTFDYRFCSSNHNHGRTEEAGSHFIDTLCQPVHECRGGYGPEPPTDFHQHQHQGTARFLVCTLWS
jgi:hypothetical protein